ncbi:MAG TPA: MdtA/MuxA family multidrug efflux RND transporter periplasmic adaptor subunit [Syntrophorhabdales bacterium]|nr:MdtA/MuxA family multidrug efflux RND transporter periplasmic adaptor subunit [Syntrophorhabdales bacterium]
MPAQEAESNAQSHYTGSSSRRKRWWIFLLVICLLAVGVYALLVKTGKIPFGGSANQAKAPPPGLPVVAVPAKKGDFNIFITGLGAVTPVYTVTVKSRVDGQLMEVLYREGQMVKQGDLLAVIDPRPFQVQLMQAEGQLARDEALLKNAVIDVERYRVLWQQDSVQKQQLDTQEALVRQYEGVVKTDRGLIDSAKLQLIYCRIMSPISGRVGLRLVDPGNIVHATDPNGLLVITQLQPITVIFPISEDYLPLVVPKLRAGKELIVEAYDREDKHKLAVGSLLTIDNQVDPTTGTVKFRAIFPNKGDELFPNQFVNAHLLVDLRVGATIVQTSAIQRGPRGTYVYVVNKDKTVTQRLSEIGETQRGQTIIKAGVEPGELVVVDGAERLRDGARVEVKVQADDRTPKGGR